MTLLIAQKQATQSIWMVADTAVTMGPLGLRDREYRPKVIPVHEGRALVGFSGDLETGLNTIIELESLSNSTPAADISHMLEKRRGHKGLGFAYAWFDDGPHLVRIDDDRVEHVQVLYLGDQDAFGSFQRIRHDPEHIHPPDALRMLQAATRDRHFQMDDSGLGEAITAFWLLFSSRQERSVGGWAVPYVLTGNGASLVSYAYSSSDPIMNRLLPGDIIPHGTATGGGFGFSLTELPDHAGFVAYWQQLPGGFIVRRRQGAIQSMFIAGSPSEFKKRAADEIETTIDLWFGEEKLRRVVGARDLLDDHGRSRIRILTHEDGSHVFQWVQRTPESFRATETVDLQKETIVKEVAQTAIAQTRTGENRVSTVASTLRILFTAPLNATTVIALQQVIDKALNELQFRDIQLVMSSSEGQHDAGFNLYGLLRSLPVPVHVHAAGLVGRISVFAYLAGHRRTCAPTATFEFHPFGWGFGGLVTIPQMEFAIDRLRNDIELAKEIMRRHAPTSSNELERLFGPTPIILSSSEAASLGIVQDILDLNSEGDQQDNVQIASINWQSDR